MKTGHRVMSLLLVVAVMVVFSVSVCAGSAFTELNANILSGNAKVANSVDVAGARADYLKALAQAENPADKSFVMYKVVITYQAEKDYDTAIAKCDEVIALVKADPQQVSMALESKGDCYMLQEKPDVEKAQAAYLLVCNFGGYTGSFEDTLRNKIDITVIGKTSYLEYCNKLLAVTPADAGNARFLGYVKSEIELKSSIK